MIWEQNLQLWHGLKIRASEGDFNRIKLAPNPASDYTVFEWDLKTLEGKAELSIRDINGRLIEKQLISNKQGHFLWDTRPVKNGVYLFSVFMT